MSDSRVIVLRHGRTAWNAQRRFQGQADPPLDDVGRMQAWEAAGLVAALEPTRLISSDLQRALQTAEPLAELTGLPVATDVRLRERSLGHWEGLVREEVQQRYPDEFADWLAGRDVSRRGGESRPQVALRSRAFFDELPQGECIVLITHSATAMALCADVLGLSQERHALGPLANCHWAELRFEEENWRLRAHNVGAPGLVVPHARTDEQSENALDADA